MARRRRLKVFISYARNDQKKAEDLYKRLTNDGVDTWFDDAKLAGGHNWEHEIQREIHESDIVLVCLSKQFDQKGFRQKELILILNEADLHPKGEIFIIPVRFEDYQVLDVLKYAHWVDFFDTKDKPAEHGYQDLLRSLYIRARQVGASLGVKNGQASKVSPLRRNTNKIIPDDVLKTWFIRHGMVINPFRCTDSNNYLVYPDVLARPDQWDLLFEPIPLVAHCPTIEDAQALAYLLKKECLPLKKGTWEATVNQQIFPVVVWSQQLTSAKPLLILAHSAAQAWLDILPAYPHAFLGLSLVEQGTLIEFLCWSLGSKNDLIRIIQLAGASQTDGNLNLIRKVSSLNSKASLARVPQDDILLSWLKIRPFGIEQTNLIFYGDILPRRASKRWVGQFDSLVSTLIINEIVPKFITSHPSSNFPSFEEIQLSWSDERLARSLEGQFDVVTHSQEKLMGKFIHFHELFGPGSTLTGTTHRFISMSRNSLAHMLILGNRLLQYHFETRGISEKYLYVEDLETILNTE